MKLIDNETLTRLIVFSAENPDVLEAFITHSENSNDRYYRYTKQWAEWTSEEARDKWLKIMDQE